MITQSLLFVEDFDVFRRTEFFGDDVFPVRSANSAEMSIGRRYFCDGGCGLDPSVMLVPAMRADAPSSKANRSA